MILLAVNQLRKSYGASTVLQSITMEIKEGERVAIIGENGSGKSTLFKIWAGMEQPDQGDVFIKKGTVISYLPQLPVYPPTHTGRDVIMGAFAEFNDIKNRMHDMEQQMSAFAHEEKHLTIILTKYQALLEHFEKIGGYQIDATFSSVVQGLGIGENLLFSPFHQLSGGEKTKVGLARLLCQKADVLLLDEPTNHLDMASIEWLKHFVHHFKGTVVMISHDRYFLDQTVCQVYEIDDGEIHQYAGNYSDFEQEKENRILQQFAEYKEQQKKIKQMKDAITQLLDWGRRGNNEKFIRRARSMQKALERITRIKRPQLEADKIKLSLSAGERSGKDVILLKDIDKSFMDKRLLSQINMHLRYGERRALLGPNGAGKTTLINLLLGNTPPDQGEITTGSNVNIGYLSQEIQFANPEESLLQAFRGVIPATEGESRQLLARFQFYGHSVFRKVGNLSGGEAMRLHLACFMYQDINFLILDEPTNHLDIDSREVLEETLHGFAGTLLIVSHDRYFLERLVNGVYWLEGGKLTFYPGKAGEVINKRLDSNRSAANR